MYRIAFGKGFDGARNMVSRLRCMGCGRRGGKACGAGHCIVSRSWLQCMRLCTSALRFARRNKLPLTNATTSEAWRDESFGGTLAFARVTGAECCAADLIWINMSKLVAPKIRNCKLSEQIIEDRGRVLDRPIPAPRACRLEAREGKGIDELFQRNAILQSD